MALTTCDDGHQEIVYDDYVRGGRSKCPLCAVIEERDTIISNLKDVDAYTYGGGSAEAELDKADEFYRQIIADALP